MKFTKLCLFLAAMGALVIGSTGGAFAGAKNADLSVTASVAANCTISTSAVAFGAYDPLSSSALNQDGAVTVACTKGTNVSIGLGAGQNAGGVAGRQMTDGGSPASLLSYGLYRNAGRTQVWGTTIGTDTLAVIGANLTPVAYPVYGQIPVGQDVSPAASYADTVVATVNF